MLRRFFNLDSKEFVPFKKASVNEKTERKTKSFDELKKLASDTQKTTLELELKNNPLSKDEVETLAKTVMQDLQPETYQMLAAKFPQIITPAFTDKTLNQVQPSNEFVAPLWASGSATIFDEKEKTKIEKFEKDCHPSKHFVILKGDWYDSSEFKNCYTKAQQAEKNSKKQRM